MIVLGIDPGLVNTGLGVIESKEGSSRLLATESIRTRPSMPLVERLATIHRGVKAFVERWRPDTVAMESLFFAKNVRTAVLLAHARAAAMLAASERNIEVVEYSPLEIKQAVVGYGRAGKDQVLRMVDVLLRPSDPPGNEHIADALACALCHAHRQNRPTPMGGGAKGRAGGAPDTKLSPAKQLLAMARRGRRRGR